MDYTEQLKEMGFEHIKGSTHVLELSKSFKIWYYKETHIQLEIPVDDTYLDLSHLSIDQLKQLVELLKPVK
jgi:hypothetical protein